ncbi:MAG: cytochrome c3 family protein [Candidatus Methanoperedens sp.]|jgi:hypothetical protein|nr:cytochrome c3 family protein [Candidatus Methanoperedens sp.]PKL54050.1 MAG: hypothetical protein CVV36_03630 [Candidatus Methanoperedenaceae archaeon HGW-Methanoperedenaceae-1]
MNKNDINTRCMVLLMLLVISVLFLVHPAMAKAPELPNNSCADCHRQLLYSTESQREFIDVRIKHLESGITCSIVCHEDNLNKSTASTYAMWSISTHALYDVTCEKCHGGDPSAESKNAAHKGLSSVSISRTKTPETCGECHERELDEFKSSKHYTELELEERYAPTCITCHQAHSVHVLTPSEIEDFCSNCHNRITGIDTTVPVKAQQALSDVSELEVGISKARSAVISAKAKGLDVGEAEDDLNSARTILRNVPSVWHRFNLTYFETEVGRGIELARKAEAETSGARAATPVAAKKTPGFEGILLITSMLAAAYCFKRY